MLYHEGFSERDIRSGGLPEDLITIAKPLLGQQIDVLTAEMYMAVAIFIQITQ
jgi:hypothetical protein